MKLFLALLTVAVPQLAHAQVTNRFAPEAQPFSGVSPIYTPSIGLMDIPGSGDTPTMREQRLKRIAAFKNKAARLANENGGSLTANDQAYLAGEARKLAYRNR